MNKVRLTKGEHDSTPKQLPLPIDGATVDIPLTKGYVAIVDAVDADLLEYKWYAETPSSECIYARRTLWVKQTKQMNREVMHRIILQRIIGRPLFKHEQVDHKDRNTLNNCRNNLRLANNSENTRNQKRSIRNTSGFKGVYCRKRINGKNWAACIKVDGVTRYLGAYFTPEEAHETYCKAAREYFGEYARFD